MSEHEKIETIRSAVAEYERLQNDPEPFLAMHTPGTAIVNLVGRRVLGRDSLGEAMVAAMASPLAKIRTSLEIEDIRFARPDVAVVSLTKTVHDGRDETAAQPDSSRTGSLTLVLTLDDGAWRIALSQTTPHGTF
ncbi:SgcJ/EcaC family oxidoreductase [Phytomonospora sp. NPDC050363]|uniref:SgcJ/EcaC family oxidoreductase n=1 Tax=Phytomonospora sp. NPDC050363 TaxID=3155642 RepID=UPI0033D8CEB9